MDSPTPPILYDTANILLSQREKLWVVDPWPCIGHNIHLSFGFTENPRYQEALQRLKAPGSTDTLLDLACMVGQVVRGLTFEGVDSSRLYGADLRQGYLDIGHELWNDKDKTKATFVAGNLLEDPEDGRGDPLAVLDGKITIVHMQNFFHLFTWEEQVKGARRIIKFLKPGVTNHMIFGEQVGTLEPGIRPLPGTEKVITQRYVHDEKTWQKLWDEVGSQTGTKWKVQCEFSLMPDHFMKWEGTWPGADTFRNMKFGIYRVA